MRPSQHFPTKTNLNKWPQSPTEGEVASPEHAVAAETIEEMEGEATEVAEVVEEVETKTEVPDTPPHLPNLVVTDIIDTELRLGTAYPH